MGMTADTGAAKMKKAMPDDRPEEAVGAIAIAYPAEITASVIGAAGMIFGFILLLLSLSGMLDRIARLFTQPVVRGIQLALGLVFLQKGIELPPAFLHMPSSFLLTSLYLIWLKKYLISFLIYI